MTRPRALIAAELGALLAEQPGPLALLRELLSEDVLGQSKDTSSDNVLLARREADRLRKKTERIQLAAAKQTMGSVSEDVHGTSEDASKDKGLPSCDLLPSSSIAEPLKSKKAETEKCARARGTRLSAETKISTENRYFAAAAGVPEPEIERVWLEFVDYWIAVPGARGTKLSWDATWRNRVRSLTPWKGRTNGARPRTQLDAANDLIARAEEHDREESAFTIDLTAERH